MNKHIFFIYIQFLTYFSPPIINGRNRKYLTIEAKLLEVSIHNN